MYIQVKALLVELNNLKITKSLTSSDYIIDIQTVYVANSTTCQSAKINSKRGDKMAGPDRIQTTTTVGYDYDRNRPKNPYYICMSKFQQICITNFPKFVQMVSSYIQTII